ncbi:VCBS repeat-containing protein [Paraglaciecola sp. L3A3]|uniref:FG-GAP repeat domain-containing protein n=1 Tax=Paraglaciecola sp. L3A3 TaxID=2686358 RepID=UPI00131B5209|nr:VCBS repeat-containing protein [Paraglaciecola sp. L3A3]
MKYVNKDIKTFCNKVSWLLVVGLLTMLSSVAQAITLEVTSDGDHIRKNTYQYYKIIVSNTDSVTRGNVVVTTSVPTGTTFYKSASLPQSSNCNNNCSSGNFPQWILGDLAAGETRVIIAPLYINSNAAEGLVTMTTSVVYDGISSAISKDQSLTIDIDAPAALSVTAKHQQILAGEEIDFEISFGNVGNSGWVSTELKASLPAGTSFVSASDGATLVGSEIVWDSVVTNVGTSSKRFFTVKASNSASQGTIYTSLATLSNNSNVLTSVTDSVIVKNNTDLTLDVTVTGDTRTPGQYLYYRYVVANKGALTMADVQLNVMMAASSRFSESASLPTITNCSSIYCRVGEWGTLTIGQLDAGESQVLLIPIYDNNPVDGAPWVSHAVVSESSGSYTVGTKPTVLYDDSLGLMMSITSDKQVVAAQENHRYEISYGNVSGSAIQNLELEVALADGVSFVKASDGGSYADGVVSWTLDTLNSGVSGKRYVTVTAPSGLADGNVLVSEAQMNNGGPSLVRASESVVIKAGVDLTLDVTVTGDTRTPGQYLYYRYVVANKGALTMTDVQLNVMMAASSRFSESASLPTITNCSSIYCGGGEWGTLTIGQLDAGESQVLLIPIYDNNPVDGAPWVSHAVVSESSGSYTVGTKPTVLYDDSLGLMMSITSDKQVVAAQENHRYEISYGNVSGSAIQNLELEVALADGVSFVKASDGGSYADGVVSWTLDTLNSGVSGKRYVTVTAPSGLADGNVLVSEAQMNNGGPSLVRASESVVIKAGVDLTLDVTVTGDTRTPGQYLYYRYVVANKGALTMTDVQLNVMMAASSRFSESASLPTITNCSSIYCGGGEWGTLTIGQLDAGESQVLLIPIYDNNPVDGAPWVSHAVVSESSGSYTVGTKPTVLYDDSLGLMMSITSDKQVVAAQENHRYEISYGNVSGSAIQNLELEVALADGVSFVKASDGGTFADGVVSWGINTLNSGTSGKRYVTVTAPDGIADGMVLVSEAQMNNGGPSLVRASESVVIKAGVDLTLDVTVTGDFKPNSDYLYYRYVVANKGSLSLTDVQLNVMMAAASRFSESASLPTIANCSSIYCGGGEWGTLTIGQLDAGESRVLLIPVYGNDPVDGAPWVSHAVVSESSGSYAVGTKPTVSYAAKASVSNPQLVLEADKYAIQPSEQQTFKLSLGNITGTALKNALMSFEVPEGYQYVSASGLKVLEGKKILWPIGNLDNQRWIDETVTLEVLSSGIPGQVLVVEGELRDGNNENLVARASVSSVVQASQRLSLNAGGIFISPLVAGSSINVNLVTTNSSSIQLADVDLLVMVPNYTSAPESTAGVDSCSGSSCEVYEWAHWDLGNLDPTQSKSNSIYPKLYTGNSAPASGTILSSNIVLTQGSLPKNDIALIRSWGVGTEFVVNTTHDSDGDLIPDWWEMFYSVQLDRLNSSDATLDYDEDGLTNLEEYQRNTNIANSDTDGDGLSDSVEVEMGTSPVLADTDGDGLNDLEDKYPTDSTRPRVRNDVNGDRKSDLLWRSEAKGWNFLWAMDGVQTEFASPINVVQDDGWLMAGQGDYDDDGKSDIFWRNTITGQNFIYLMDGLNIKARKVLNYVDAPQWELAGSGDFNGDGKGDVMWRRVDRGDTWFYMMDGLSIGTNQPSLWVTDLNYKISAIGDINGDGTDDVIWRHQVTGINYIWIMENGQIANRYTLNSINSDWTIAGTGDLDGDGTDDIILRNQVDGRNWVYLMEDGQIKTSQLMSTVADTNWQIANMGDYDGDGKTDILWRDESAGRNIIHLMDGLTIKDKGVLRPTDNTWQLAK